MKKLYSIILTIAIFCCGFHKDAEAAVVVTPFADRLFCFSSFPTAYQNVGTFRIGEGNNTDFNVQNNRTIIITLPAGFEFNTAAGPSVTFTGLRNISALSFTWNTTSITVTLSVTGTNRTDQIQFNNFQVRATALGTGDLVRTGGTFTINGSTANPSSTTSLGNLNAVSPTTYVSSTVAQASIADITKNCTSVTNEILEIQVTVSGDSLCPENITQFNFSTNGDVGFSQNPATNITRARLYYSGKTQAIDYSNFVGYADAPNGAFTINGTKILANGAGTYYFYLTYDVPATAAINEKLDASMVSFVMGGTTISSMTVANPAGTRMIVNGVCPSTPDLPNPAANLQSVTAGSLVIPMDNSHQNLYLTYPFNIKAYGLVNALLQNDIPVKWVIKSGKAKDDIDFSAVAARVYPTTTVAAMQDFRGSAFIIDTTWLNRSYYQGGQTATQVISAFANTWRVAVYRLTNDEVVDVRYTLNQRPKIAVFSNGTHQEIHSKLLDSAKISNYVVINAGNFTGLAECYTFCSEAHWDYSDNPDTIPVTRVREFVSQGGNFLAQCAGINLYENRQRPNHFHSTDGIQGYNNTITNAYYNHDMAFNQFEGNVVSRSGTIAFWERMAGSEYLPGLYPSISTVPATDTIAAAGIHLGAPSSIGSNVFYLGGHDFMSSIISDNDVNQRANLNYINGARMYLNAALIPANRPTTFSITPGNNTTICEGGSTVLGGSPTGPAGATYIWSPSTGLNDFNAANPVASPTVTTTYSLMASNGNCPAGPALVTVTVIPEPTVSSVATGTICSNAAQNYTITTSVPGATISWSRAAVPGISNAAVTGQATATITETLINTTNAPINVIYLITPSMPSCPPGPTFTYTVTVNPRPAVTNLPTKGICTGTSTALALTASVASNFTWTIGTITGGITGASAGSGATINQTLTNPSSVSTGTVQYIVTPTSTVGGCVGAPFTITVSVSPTPLVTSSAATTICNNLAQNYTITSGVAGATFSWSRGAVAGISNAAVAGQTSNPITETLVNTTNAPVSVIYSIVPSAAGCVGPTFTYTVTVNPTPTITSAGTGNTCSGYAQNYTITSNVAGSTYSWSRAAVAGVSNAAVAGQTANPITEALVNTTTAPVNVIYSITPTANGCAGTPFTYTVTVNPTPTVTTGAAVATCSGTNPSIALTATVASSFAWTIGTITGGITGASAGSGATINQVLTNPSNATAGTVQYIVTPTSTTGNCAGSPFTITVTVNPTPAVTNAATATICSATSPNIGLNATVPSSFSWTIGTITGGITGASASSGPTINQVLNNPSSSAAGSVQYLVTPTSTTGACAGNPFTITVNVNPTPVVTNAATAAICNNTAPNTVLTSSAPSNFAWTIGTITGGITGASSGSGTTLNQTLTNPSSASAGTIQYRVTPTSTGGGCVGAPYTITYTVNPTPAVTNAAAVSICSGTNPSITLTASAASTFSWTIGTITGGITGASAGTGATINQILANPSNATAGTVQYIVTPTSTGGNCAGSPYTITVTVNPTPAVNIAASYSICSSSSQNVTLTATAPSSFAWTIGTITGGITGASAGSGSAITQTLTNPSNATAGTVQYLITPTSTTGGCVGSPFTATFTVNPTPAVTNAATAAICNATSPNITLTSSAPSTFTWTIGTITGGITGASAGSGGILNQTLTNPSGTAVGSVQYVVTPTSTTGACVGAPFTITVTVNPTPTVTNPNTASICNATSPNITLTSTTPSTYTWTIGTITGGITGASAGSGGTINQTLTNPSNATAGTVQYIITPTSTGGSCVGAPFTITVTVNPTPAITSAASYQICSGAAQNVVLTSTATSTFAWTIGTITGGITGASAGSGPAINQTLTNPGTSAAGTVQYIVTPTSSAGCAGTPLTMTFTVNPRPVLTTATTYSVCSGSAMNVVLTASASSSFAWTIGNITGSITGASAGSGGSISQTLTNPSNATAGTVEYIVTPTFIGGGCAGPSTTLTFTVNPTPVVTTANTAAICNGATTNIALTASAASTFTWTIGTITGGITGASAGSGSTIAQALSNPSSTTAGTVQYIVVPTSSNGCVGPSYTITVTVNPTPAVTNPATTAICTGNSTGITLTASAPSSFTWTVGTITGGITGASSGSGGTINQVLTNPSNATAGTVEYLVTPTSGTGSCGGTPFTITVTVNPRPVVTNASSLAICNNTSPNLALTASTPSTFTWTIGTVTGSIAGASAGSGSTINQTLTNPSNATAGSVQYIVTATSIAGCPPTTVTTLTVTVNPIPVVTNAATKSICNNTNVNIVLTSSAPSNFAWTIGTITGGITGALAGSGGTISQTLTNPSNSTAGTVQYIVTPTSTGGGCAGAPFTITVTVNPTPVMTIDASYAICSGTSQNVTLTSSAPSSYAWTLGTNTGGITGATAGSGAAINQVLTNPSNATAGSVQYIITPTSTTGSCAGTPLTITFTVNPKPVVTNPATASICNGTSPNITLAATAPSNFAWTIGTITGSITGASAGSGGTINQTLVNPSNTTAGSVQYIVTSTSVTGSCAGNPFTITITVNPTPAVTNAATKSICNGNSTGITLTSSAPSTFAWTIGTVTGGITGASAGSGGSINQTLTNPSNSTAGTVEYIVTPTAVTGSCAGTPFTITVTVSPTPAVTNSSTTAICNNTSPNIALTSSTPGSFAWTIGTITGGITGASPGTGTTINQTLVNPSGTAVGSVQYLVTPTSTTGSCPGAPFTITVTVNPTPTVTNPNTAVICSGDDPNIALTSTTPSNYAWTIGTITGGITGASAGSGGTISQTLTNPSNATAGTVQYIVTPTSTGGNCVGASFTITVTVNPRPAVTNPATIAICNATSPNISLTATAASSFAWTIGTNTGGITGASAGSGNSINQILSNPSNSTAGSVQYIVTPTSTTGSCTGAPYTITVSVNPTPAVTNPATASTCSNTSPNIVLTASVPSSFAWTIGTITGGISGASAGSGTTINQTLNNPSNSAPGSVEYIVTPTSTTGSCPGAPYTITVTVNPTPVVTTASSISICSNTSPNIVLTATTASTNFTWTVGTITGGITGATAGSGGTINQVLTNPNNATAGSVQYIIIPTSVGGSCPGSPYTITVTVNPTPAVNIGATYSVCSGAAQSVTLTSTAPSNFAWTIGNITGGITGATAGSGSVINQTLTNPSNATAGTVEYIITPTSTTGGCAGAPFTATFTVNPRPAVTNAPSAAICSNTSPNIALTASAPSTFAWTIGTITGSITGASAGSGTAINQTLTNPGNSTAGSVQYIVTPTSTTGGCAGSPFTITITVNPTPVVTNPATVAICNATSPNITLAATAASNFAWTIGTVTGGITGATAGAGGLINQTLTNPSNTTAGTVEYIVTPTSVMGGCVGAPYTITVTVNPTPAVTNNAATSICTGTGPNIALTSSAPASFAWTIGVINGGITGASAGSGNTINQTLTNPGNATAGSVEYIVTPTSTTGACGGSPFTVTVTVNPRPVVTNPGTLTICNSTSPNITLAATTASTFSWTIGNISGSITGASAGSGGVINQALTNPSNATAGSVEYIVTSTSITGSCVGIPYTITVTVNPTPAVTNPASVSICNSTSPTISLTATAASNFTWTIGTVTGGITGATAGAGNTINQVLTNPSNSTAGTVQYIVTPTSVTGTCVGAPYTITVTVNPTPGVTNPGTATICSGTSPNISLTSTAASNFSWTIGAINGGITGATAGSGTTINQVLTNPGNATAGSVEYIVTPSSTTGSCGGAPFSIIITVNPIPAMTNSPNASICNGGNPNIALSATTPSTFGWTVGTITGSISGATPGTGATISQVLTNPSAVSSGNVEYVVTPTSNAGCVGAPFTITATVTVFPTPVMTNAPTASTCSGTSPNITLTASTPSTFIWSIGNITGGITGAVASAGAAINQTLTNPSNSSAGTVEYIVTPTSIAGSCPGNPFTITVTVNPTPAITNAPAATICNATSPNITLTSSAPATFAWTIGNINGGITGASAGTGTTLNQVLTNPSNATAGSVEYIVTPTSTTGSCAGSPFTITVTVNPTPVVTNPATLAICNNTSPNITLTSSLPSNFSWTIGTVTGSISGATAGTGGSINQTLINPSNTTAGSVEYIITPTSVAGNCVGAPYTITVTVNPTPAITNPSTVAICNNTSPNIALTATAASNFAWTIGTITGGITGATAGAGSTINQVLTNPSNATAGSVQYIVTPTSTTGSCTPPSPFTITVTVNPTPVVTNGATLSICNNTSPNLTLTSSTPSTFAWTIGTITGSITGASAGSGTMLNQTLTNPSNATSGTVEYIITPTSTTGNCVAASPYIITITVNPTPAITNPSTTSICSGTSPNIALAATTASNFAWTIGTVTGGITGATAGSGNTINQVLTNPSNATAGSVQYVVTPTSVTGSCTPPAPFTITVTVNPRPVVTNSATATICNNTSPNIALTSTTPANFSWTIGAINGGITGASAGSGTSINQVLTNPSNAITGSVEYLVTPTSTTGACVSLAPYSIVVTVNPTPVVTNPANVSICNATSPNIMLAASAPATFAWTIGSITGSITGASAGSGSTINQTLTNPSNTSAGSVQYIVTPTSTNGCTGAPYTITVTVNPTPAVTNPSTLAICNATSPNISLTASAPSTFAWTIGTVSGGITGATAGSGSLINQTLTNPSNATAGSVQYIVTPTSVTGNCVGAPFAITVTMNPTPAVTNASAAAICTGTSPNIPLTSSAPSTFAWTIGAINGGITGASNGSGSTINQTLTNPSNATAGSIEYIVTPTSSTGTCTGAPFIITVTVNPRPVVTNPSGVSICNNISPNLALTASTPSTFTWTIGSINGSITGASAGSGSTINQVLTNPSNATAGSVQYIVTPTSTAGNCVAGTPFTITVTVNPTPAVTNPATMQICNNTSPNISLTASTPSTFTWTVGTVTGGITGATAGAGNTINQTLTNPNNSTAGTVQYIVTPTSLTGSCAGAPFTITVTVNPTPAVTSSSTAAICTGGSPNISLTASAPSSFSWTIGAIIGGVTGASNGGGNTINQVLNNPGNSVTGSVQYIITPTSNTGNCVGAPFTITVTVHPRPVVTSPSTATVCSGLNPSVALTASTPSSFTWTIGSVTGGITGASAGSGNTINQVLTNPGNTASGTVQYIITPTSLAGNCIGNPFTITITVYPRPTVTSASAGSICNGLAQNYLITGSVNPGITFTWSRPAVTGISNPAVTGQISNPITESLTNTTNVPVNVVYSIVPSANGCSGTPFDYTLTVYSTPNVTSANTGVVCSGVSQNYLMTSAVAGATFSWDRPAVAGISNAAVTGQTANPITESLVNTTTAPVDVFYLITPSATGCSPAAPFSYKVTVNPATFVTNANTMAICSGTSPNIGLTSSVASSFTWTVGTINGGITGASAGSGNAINQVLTNPDNTTAGSVQYLITPTSVVGNCAGAVYSIIVTVNPRPVVTNPASLAICNATSPNITLTASAPSTFTWAVGTVTGGITGASSGSGNLIDQVLGNPSASIAGTVEYVITPTTTVGGCTSVGTPYSIIVTVNPTPDVTNAPAATICNGNSPNITLTSTTPSTFAWTIGTITGSIGGASAGSGNIINQTLTNPTNTAAGTVQYIVTPTSVAGGCIGAPDTITVSVNPTPLVTNPPAVSICNNTSPGIALTSTTASTFTWTIGSVTGGITGASGGAGSMINNILTNSSNSAAGTVQYLITATATTGCVGPQDTITVTVNPTPVITTPALASICSGTTTNIALTSTTPSSFSWTIGTITGGITGATPGSGSTISQLLTNPGNSTAGTVAYIVTPVSTTGSCTGSPLTIIVTVNPTPAVTNPTTKEICSGTSTNIALTSTASSNFSWTIGTITGGITGASAGTGSTINQVLGNPSNSTAGTVEYIVTPTSTTGSCASSPYTITVTVNPIPVVTNGGTAAICNNTSPNILLTSSTPATFSWTIGTVTGGIVGGAAGTGNNINQTLLNPSNTTAGTVEYRITPTSTTGACVNLLPYTITVTVNPTPAMNTNTTDTICSDGTTNIALSATVPSTFTWTVGNIIGGITGGSAGSGSVISHTLTNPSNTAAGSIQYIVTPTSTTGGCANSSPYTITVTVNPKPAMTTPPTTSICNGGNPNIPLTASIPATFTWTIGTVTGGITGASAGSGNVISQVLNNPSAVSTGSVEYIVTPTSANGCVGAPFSIVAMVTVFPTPVITNAPTVTTCNGTGPNISLTATTPSTFAWTIGAITGSITGASPGSGNTINQTLTNPSNSANGTVQYIITATSIAAGCPSAPDTITVTVFPSPLVTSAASATICNNTPQNYILSSSTSGATYTWSRPTILGIATPPATGTTSTITEQLNNTSITPINVPYTINATANGCTGPAFTYTVTVNPTPAVTSVPTGTICSGVAQNYTITTAVSGTTLVWSRGATPGISNPPASGNTPAITETLINTTTSPINVVYIVSPVAYGCNLVPPFAYTVTVNPTPVATAANDGPKCAGTTLTLTSVSTLPGSSFNWTGPGGFGATGTPVTISNVTAANNGDYFVTASLNGCNSAPVKTTVLVANIPAIASAGPDQTYCVNNNEVSLNGSIAGGTTTGIWTSTGTGQFTPTNTTLPNVKYKPSASDLVAGSVTINLTTTNTGVCPTTTDAAVITFSPAPTVYAGPDAGMCADTTIFLNGLVTGSTGGVWSTSGTGSFSPNNTSLGITYTPGAADRAAGRVSLYLTSAGNGNCNEVVDTMEITIVPLPKVNLGPDIVILEGAIKQLNPVVSGNNLTYLWTPNANMNNNTVRNPIVTGNSDMLLTLTVTGENNCVARDQILISVLRPFKVPNTFTPNGDGINDTWVIDKLSTYPGCRVQVFNRYGQMVFESFGYPVPWNGTMAGKPVPFGTYYYIIEPGNGRLPLKGYVTVLR